MLKVGLLAGLAVLAVAVPVASASSDTCRAAEKCTVRTADTHVDGAIVRMDADTAGRYRLTCVKGSQAATERGLVGLGERLIISTELNNSACVLKAKGFSDGTARVRATLTH